MHLTKEFMLGVLHHTPGAQVSIILEILNDTTGVREDGYSTPKVQNIILPDLSESTLYPLDMVRISTGLYYHRFTLPTGAAGIGSYIVDLSWRDAANNPKQGFIQVICSSTAGSFSVSPS